MQLSGDLAMPSLRLQDTGDGYVFAFDPNLLLLL